MTEVAVDVEIEADDRSPSFNRRVALAVALIALVGALVGLLHTYRSGLDAEAGRDSQLYALERMSSLASIDANTFYDTQVVTARDRLQARAVLEGSRELTARPGSPEASAAADAAPRLQRLADALDGIAAAPSLAEYLLSQESGQGPTFEAEYRQELAAQASTDNGAIADACVTVLAILAVSLFLLGLSVAVERRGRFVLAIPGVVVAVVGAAWGLALARSGPDTVEPELVARTGEARALVAANDNLGAVEVLDEVLADDADYARALAIRAFARTVAEAGEIEDYGSNLHYVDPGELEVALADAQAAQDGLPDDLINQAVLAFLHLNRGDGGAAVTELEALVDRNPDDAFNQYGLAAARVLAGDDDGASATYADALDALGRLLDKNQVRAAAMVIAQAYSDGEQVLKFRPEAEAVVDEARADLVAAVPRLFLRDQLPDDAATAELAGDPVVAVFGPNLFVSGAAANAPADLQVTSVWLRTPPEHGDSAPYVPTGSIRGPMVITTPVGPGGTFTQPVVNPLGSAGHCPVPGEYRVDVWLGRELGGSASVTVPESPVGDLVFDENDVPDIGVCRPSGWKVERGDKEVAFVDPDSAERIELRAFPSTAAQRNDRDSDAVVAAELEDRLDEAGFELTEPVRAYALPGQTDDNRFACVRAGLAFGEDDDGRGRAQVLTLGPDGVFRELVIEADGTTRPPEIGDVIGQSVLLRAIGDVPAGSEFAACSG